MQDKKTEIYKFLKEFHTGREKAVCSKELERLFSLNGRNIRRKVSKLRQEGIPICSDKNGYYYADCESDVDETAYRLGELVKSVSSARIGLLYARNSV